MANAVLQYDFAVVGDAAIKRAFASVEARASRHNQKMAKMFSQPAQVRSGSRKAASRMQPQLGPARREFREQVKLDQKRNRFRQQMRNRYWTEEARRRQREERAARRGAERLAKAQRRAAEKQMLSAQRERKRSAQGLFGRMGNSARGSLRAVGGAGAMIGLGGGFMASAAIGQQSRETAMASQLANQAGTPGIKKQLLRESQSVRGFSGEETLAATTAFVDLTGDLKTARILMRDLAEFSHATATSFQDSTAMAGNFANSLQHIKDPAERAAAVMDAMRGVGGGAMVGAVETKHLASMGGRISAIASGIGGDRVEAVKKAGVLAQIAKQKSGSPEEAVTAAQNFIDAIGQKADIIEKSEAKGGLGIKGQFEIGKDGARTAIKDPKQLMMQLMEKTGGDIGELTKLLGRRGQRVTKALSGVYKSEGTGGIDKLFSRILGAELSRKDITSRAESRLSDPDLQFKEAIRDFNAAVGGDLLPALTDLIPVFKELVPLFATGARVLGKFVRQFIDSPLTTIGSLIAGKIVMDLAAAQIGKAVKETLTEAFSGGGKGGAGTTGGKGGMDIGGAISNGLAMGAMAGLTIYAHGVTKFHAGEVKMDESGKMVSRAREIQESMRKGEISGEEGIKKLRALRYKADDETHAAGQASTFERVLGFFAQEGFKGLKSKEVAEQGKEISPFRDDTVEATLKQNSDEIQRILTESMGSVKKEQSEAAKELKGAAEHLSKVFPGDGGSAPPNRGNSPSQPR